VHLDALIIGAGMSGLAAGIRLAMFDRRVCIVEKHYAYGGLNSYYTRNGRSYDVGLHAVTNAVPPGVRDAPLPRLLRQLRIQREELDLHPQGWSEIHFPRHRLRFSNDITMLLDEARRAFPSEVDGLRRLIADIEARPFDLSNPTGATARQILPEYIREPLLREMLLCPVMYYGCSRPDDMDFAEFALLFRSIFCEGFARPREGVRRIIRTLVRAYRRHGGKLRMRCGVERIETRDGRVSAVHLDSGEVLTADVVISSVGYDETMRLCGTHGGRDERSGPDEHGGPHGGRDERGEPERDRGPHSGPYNSPLGERLSFVESVTTLDVPPRALGLEATIVFFNLADGFTYARPDDLIDERSGVICCPNNYEGHDDMPEGIVRVTWLANYERWAALPEGDYAAAKREVYDRGMGRLRGIVPDFGARVVDVDLFTPRTIERYTGHIHGAVYGSPVRRPDGRTPLANLFVCGTDTGLVGIIGALWSGVVVANRYGLP
jgi:phytoene dehydrogenase-like protein